MSLHATDRTEISVGYVRIFVLEKKGKFRIFLTYSKADHKKVLVISGLILHTKTS